MRLNNCLLQSFLLNACNNINNSAQTINYNHISSLVIFAIIIISNMTQTAYNYTPRKNYVRIRLVSIKIIIYIPHIWMFPNLCKSIIVFALKLSFWFTFCFPKSDKVIIVNFADIIIIIILLVKL